MKKKLLSIALTIALGAGLGWLLPVPPVHAQQAGSTLSRVAGRYMASNYALWRGNVIVGINAAATAALTVSNPSPLPDGRVISYSVGEPVNVDGDTETLTAVTPVSCPGAGYSNGCASITAAWAAAHPGGTNDIATGTFGVQEAIDDAAGFVSGANTGNGGVVVVDNPGVTNAILTAAMVMPNVSIEDDRAGAARPWNATPTGLYLAVPTTLTAQAACDATHQFCSDASAAGSASWGSTVYGCVAYVDIMGNEGPCSATSTVFTSVASMAIDVAAPAASPGAVGYVVYLSLSGGSYALAYQVPSTSANCTLTTLETINASMRGRQCDLRASRVNVWSGRAVHQGRLADRHLPAEHRAVVSHPGHHGRNTARAAPHQQLGRHLLLRAVKPRRGLRHLFGEHGHARQRLRHFGWRRDHRAESAGHLDHSGRMP